MLPNALQRISQIEKQLGKGRHHKQYHQQVYKEEVHARATTWIPESASFPDELCPMAKHTVACFLQEQDRGFIIDGSCSQKLCLQMLEIILFTSTFKDVAKARGVFNICLPDTGSR